MRQPIQLVMVMGLIVGIVEAAEPERTRQGEDSRKGYHDAF